MCVEGASRRPESGYQLFSMTFYPIPLSQNLFLYLEFMVFGEAGSQQTVVTLPFVPLSSTGVTGIPGPCLSYYVYPGIPCPFLMLA